MNLFQDCLPALPHRRAFLATWFILYRENVLNGTERAFMDVLYRENVLTCTKCVCPALFPLHHPCYVFHWPSPVRTKTFSAYHRSKFSSCRAWIGRFYSREKFSRGGLVALKRHFVLWSARRGWGLWRFASLIPSGWRLPPIHKVMGDHASRGSTPAGLFCHVFSFCVVRKSLLCNKLTFFRVAVMRTLKIDIYLMVNYLCSTPRCHFLILVDSDWSLSLKWVYSGCSFLGSIFRGSFCTVKTF